MATPCREMSLGVAPIAERECLLQQRLHACRESGTRMIVDEIASASQQVRETGLMRGVIESTIRCPAVAHEDAAESSPRIDAASRKLRPRRMA